MLLSAVSSSFAASLTCHRASFLHKFEEFLGCSGVHRTFPFVDVMQIKVSRLKRLSELVEGSRVLTGNPKSLRDEKVMLDTTALSIYLAPRHNVRGHSVHAHEMRCSVAIHQQETARASWSPSQESLTTICIACRTCPDICKAKVAYLEMLFPFRPLQVKTIKWLLSILSL
ncbi:hypothetical protein BC938DRAFT_483972 [Jimgerdemannia flammicorona]|uniref:Uncharacterized protein n=1 Tax=Jimgerdemannia flammicorona TaxID=994334 RepID=A0A433QAW0_9FUNG|nr:hypothetical protein BC938DRAFT_483972 [Jimgerdemannia flammicorona]